MCFVGIFCGVGIKVKPIWALLIEWKKLLQVKSRKYMNIIIEKPGYSISILVSGFFTLGYLVGFKLLKWTCLEFSDYVFITIFLTFVVLCNLPYLSGLIISTIREKINEQTNLDLLKTIKDKLKEDPAWLKELLDKLSKQGNPGVSADELDN